MVALDVGDLMGHGAGQPAAVPAIDAEGGAGHFDGAARCGPGTDIAQGVALAADLIPILAIALVGIELGVELAGSFLAVAPHLGQGGGVGAVVDREANGAGAQGKGSEAKGLWGIRERNLGQCRQAHGWSSGGEGGGGGMAHRLRFSGPDGPEIGHQSLLRTTVERPAPCHP